MRKRNSFKSLVVFFVLFHSNSISYEARMIFLLLVTKKQSPIYNAFGIFYMLCSSGEVFFSVLVGELGDCVYGMCATSTIPIFYQINTYFSA